MYPKSRTSAVHKLTFTYLLTRDNIVFRGIK